MKLWKFVDNIKLQGLSWKVIQDIVDLLLRKRFEW